MDFSFTPEQDMLRESLARYLARHYTLDERRRIIAAQPGYSKAVWNQFAELGLLHLPLPEALGGLGGNPVDLVAVAELLGRHAVVEPWLASSVICAPVIARYAPDRLPGLLDGSATCAFAYEEGHGTADPADIAMRAEPRGEGGFVLDGEKRLVLGADTASTLLVAARLPDGKLGLFLIERTAPGQSLTSYTTIDGRRGATVRFDNVVVDPAALLDADAAATITALVQTAHLLLSAEAVGAMEALLELAATHAATRSQFGKPIAAFQAIAHRLADMKLAYVKARSLLLQTAALAEAGLASPRDTAMLKAQAGRLGRQLGESAVQVHGGLGMTDELAVGHLLKRVLFVDLAFGAGDHHFRIIGRPAADAMPA
ncbi:MAG: acyl-CoA dehydrogenase family protein [Novosphingobium sp.]|uniref:acyl-CoA dehydrogenase family protein n=1 Tax=Novosphingobium sp. TaxID=1874826 RepID=UPI00301645AE